MTLDRQPNHPVASCEVNTAPLHPYTQSTLRDKTFAHTDVNCVFMFIKGQAADSGVEWNVQIIPGTPANIAVGI
jgi:hypothetical protein